MKDRFSQEEWSPSIGLDSDKHIYGMITKGHNGPIIFVSPDSFDKIGVEEAEANVALASKAPQMLSALRNLVRVVERMRVIDIIGKDENGNPILGGVSAGEYNNALTAAKAAIA